MSQAFKRALDLALALDESERAELAETLLATISEAFRSDIEEAWIAEIARRERAISDGTDELLDGDDILQRLSKGERP